MPEAPPTLEVGGCRSFQVRLFFSNNFQIVFKSTELSFTKFRLHQCLFWAVREGKLSEGVGSWRGLPPLHPEPNLKVIVGEPCGPGPAEGWSNSRFCAHLRRPLLFGSFTALNTEAQSLPVSLSGPERGVDCTLSSWAGFVQPRRGA